ncbi:MAG: hypothetical protein M8467_19000 [Anaerolineae bacterium]|nr:hypothetical protein [Anaerolineae bacterium]
MILIGISVMGKFLLLSWTMHIQLLAARGYGNAAIIPHLEPAGNGTGSTLNHSVVAFQAQAQCLAH